MTDSFRLLANSIAPEDRRKTIEILGNIGDQDLPVDTHSLILDALGDSDWRVRKQAVETAARLIDRLDVTEALAASLSQGENVGLRNAALELVERLGSLATDALLRAQEQATNHAVKFLADALGRTRDPRALPALLRNCASDDTNVVAAALSALSLLGGPEAEAELKKKLSDPNVFVRVAALDGLARLGAVLPFDVLEPFLEEPPARRVALELAARSRDPRALSRLLDLLCDDDGSLGTPLVRAVAALCKDGVGEPPYLRDRLTGFPDNVQRFLRGLVKSADASVRHAAVLLLLLARDDAVLNEVATMIAVDDLDSAMRGALIDWGNGAVRPLLALPMEPSHTKATALELAADLAAAPGLRGEKPDDRLIVDVRSELRVFLSSPKADIATAAARGLSWFAEACDAEALVTLAGSGPEPLARACAGALEQLRRREPEAVVVALEATEWEGAAAGVLAPVAAALDPAFAMTKLQSALSADHPATRRAAAVALASIAAETAEPLLGLALADESPEVQVAATQALGKIRAREHQPVGTEKLLLALRSEFPAVQAAAAKALSEGEDEAVLEPLRHCVQTAPPLAALAALQSLRHLKDPLLETFLVDVLASPNEETVKEALRATFEGDVDRKVQRLAVALAHDAWDVRLLAAELLEQVDSEEAREAIRARLDREAHPIVRAALEKGVLGSKEEQA